MSFTSLLTLLCKSGVPFYLFMYTSASVLYRFSAIFHTSIVSSILWFIWFHSNKGHVCGLKVPFQIVSLDFGKISQRGTDTTVIPRLQFAKPHLEVALNFTNGLWDSFSITVQPILFFSSSEVASRFHGHLYCKHKKKFKTCIVCSGS